MKSSSESLSVYTSSLKLLFVSLSLVEIPFSCFYYRFVLRNKLVNPQPISSLNEESCCRCLRRAWEIPSNTCNAVFLEEGSMIAKCGHCATARKDCVSVGFRTHTASDKDGPASSSTQLSAPRGCFHCSFRGMFTPTETYQQSPLAKVFRADFKFLRNILGEGLVGDQMAKKTRLGIRRIRCGRTYSTSPLHKEWEPSSSTAAGKS